MTCVNHPEVRAEQGMSARSLPKGVLETSRPLFFTTSRGIQTYCAKSGIRARWVPHRGLGHSTVSSTRVSKGVGFPLAGILLGQWLS